MIEYRDPIVKASLSQEEYTMAAPATSPSPVFNTVSGKILNKESGNPVADLVVVLFDLDALPDPEFPRTSGSPTGAPAQDPLAALEAGDLSTLYQLGGRIGSVTTSSSGEFLFQVSSRDLDPAGKAQKPDLVLIVLAPDEPGLTLNQRLLHFSRDIWYDAGSQESTVILLAIKLLEAKQISVGQYGKERDTAAGRVQTYISQQEQEKTFSTSVAQYHGELATREIADRQAFRSTFLKTIASDLTVAPPKGVVVADGENIQDKNKVTINNGIARANQALGAAGAQGVPVNLYLTPADRERLKTFFAGATGPTVEIPDADMQGILFRPNGSDNPGTVLLHSNPIVSYCLSADSDVACAQAHTGIAHSTALAPVVTVPTVTPPDTSVADADLPTYIARLIRDMQSPDVVLRPELSASRGDRAQIQQKVKDFSMTTGPAEDPALYDFNVVQIAFDHVWKQIFDESIPNLAYTADTIGQKRFGIQSFVSSVAVKGTLGIIDPGYFITTLEVPPVVARFFDITQDEYNEMSYNLRDQLVAIANSIAAITGTTIPELRTIQRLTEQGERLIDCVGRDDYYTLHKTLRELHARLSGTYEFTIFAADKDHHSVNFGLLTTYREQLTPVAYQAGRLVKSIPLAPKEERKYSVKAVRNRKRSRKEADKNNTSITNEQQTTSRVEAEIMTKAQTKTTFSMSASGDYDILISDGKATTSFSVDALSESTQNRKDIRDSVLKAYYEHKQETTTEVTTETDITSETTESGTIVNPNDELAVTYLFYELQKRYRLSERIYRAVPLVFVAQEVPSPDQITPAWVIANDWILNRYLLDDSFRPTLSYIANKSVGDDYALRELRKNLRQQRNLVETLRIEFSAASVEAENRYKALEAAIENRVDEEHHKATEGFGDDLLNFFGGGGSDPQAAKARELAAKDAHQYALEKAEKAATALREEVANLHTLTEAYNKAVEMRLDNETRVDRFLVHLRENIFYYMQAIWSMEPPDQRFLRLYKVPVPVLELESRSYTVKVAADPDIFAAFREPGTEKHHAFLHGSLKHNPEGSFNTKPLVEVADLDTLLGFKGNYMIFPLREHNALTEFMAAPYIDSAFGAMDPDELSNVSLDEFSKYVCCLHDKLSQADFDALKPQLKSWLEQLLASPLRNGDEIVVPTGSLFIETLVDQNPILEDFKLRHRVVDVFSAMEDSRKKSFENLRLAWRLLNAERGDPEIDKKVVVQGSAIGPSLDIDTP